MVLQVLIGACVIACSYKRHVYPLLMQGGLFVAPIRLPVSKYLTRCTKDAEVWKAYPVSVPGLWDCRGRSGGFLPGLSPLPGSPSWVIISQTTLLLLLFLLWLLTSFFRPSPPSIFQNGICLSSLPLSSLLSSQPALSLSVAAVFWKVADLERGWALLCSADRIWTLCGPALALLARGHTWPLLR